MSATLDSAAAAEVCLSPALQAYLRDCVRLRLRAEGVRQPLQMRIQLYLRLGDPDSALALEHDLRQLAEADSSVGLIAMFGQLDPGLSLELAMARQLQSLRRADARLEDDEADKTNKADILRSVPLQIGSHRYRVLTMHEHARQLHCVMPCPILAFSPLG